MSSCAELQLESDTTDGNNNNNNDMKEQEKCVSDNSKNGVEALKQTKQEMLSNGAEGEQSDPVLSHVHEEDGEAGQESQPHLRVIAPSICTSVSSPSSQMMADAVHEHLQKHPGFGIENGTLELVQVARKEWIHPQKLPLPTASPKKAPIIMEFVRHWSVLRLRPHPSESLPRGKAEMGQDQSLLKNYEPRFSVGEQTFPSEIVTPSFFDPRVAIEDAHAFLVTTHLRFTLGMVEPLFCRLVIYDISLGCRVTEEFSYSIPGAVNLSGNICKVASSSSSSMLSSVRVRQALFYALPNHLPQHLYIVLKVSKVLVGDGESATAPYCSPEKLTSESEQQKLIEKAADCFRRLGRYRQPIAWGAIALMEGCNRPMTLYRQRIAMNDEQRLPLIPEAVRGTLKEKVIPSVCEFDLKRIDDQRLAESKFQSSTKNRSLPKNGLASLPSAPILDILDPFSCAKTPIHPLQQPQAKDGNNPEDAASSPVDSTLIQCREVQPFCHPTMTSVFGLTGCGPVAVSYVNALYLYPIRLEKFQYRNIAIRVQLLQKEVGFVCGIEDLEAQSAVLNAVYAPDHEVQSAAYTLVNYHQKNPQFENEIKICLPERLTLAHHILFTFYHVHCKKLQPNQMQQELVGYAILPVLQKDGTILQDNNYVVNVFPTLITAKASTTGGVISLPAGYVAAAREAGLDNAKTALVCRTRVLSSIHSQDKAVASFLQRFHSVSSNAPDTKDAAAASLDDDQVVNKLLGLRQASTTNVRYFLFPIAKFVLGYLRFGTAVVRWAAFRAFLTVLEKASWTPHRSLKQDANQILHNFVHIVFDEEAIMSPGGMSTTTTITPESKRPQSIFHAMLIEWLLVLQDNSPVEDNIETKRLSLAYANMLLQLILKSMAMHSLRQHALCNGVAASGQLPLALSSDDDELTETVLGELVYCIGNNTNGLLFQKEVNRSIAYFCRGMFFVAKNQVPARIITQYMQWVNENLCDANVLVHILFPFLRILIDFEFFAVVNGAHASTASRICRSSSSAPAPVSLPQRSSWLAKLVFERLLCVADEQKEEKIRCDAMRLLRRLFVAHAYNSYHQSPDDQETIALIYFPFFASVAQFTAEGKLLCSNGGSTLTISRGGDHSSGKVHELRKELLICVVHLLSSVSASYISRFFQQFDAEVRRDAHGHYSSSVVPLSPTGALMHYRKIVEERKEMNQRRHRRSILNISGYERKSQTLIEYPKRDEKRKSEPPFDETRVHACLALVRHIIETFLVDEASLSGGAILWQELLSPDLVTREGRLSLLGIEMNLKHRRVSRQRNSVLVEGGAAPGPSGSSYSSGRNSGNAITNAAGLRSPNPKLISAGSSNALSSAPSPVSVTRGPNNKSLPRNWGKNYAGGGPRRTSASLGSESKSGSSISLSTQVTVATSPSHKADEEYTGDYEMHVRYLHRITAVTMLRSLRTAVDQFEWVIRLIEVPFDCSGKCDTSDDPQRQVESVVTVDQAYALLGSLTDLLFLLINRANSIETLYSNIDGDIEEDDDEDEDDSEDKDQCFLTDLFEYLQVFVVRFQKALFACRIADLPLIHDQCRIQLLLSIAATGKMLMVRQHAAKLLCKLTALCYTQTGSFSLVKRPIFKVFCCVFFSSPTGQLIIPTESMQFKRMGSVAPIGLLPNGAAASAMSNGS